MDDRTLKTLRIIAFHLKIKNYLTALCYFLIVGGLLFYIFHAATKTQQNIKLVTDYKSNPKQYKATKTMTNPRIDLQYNDTQIYHIKAEKAFHDNEEEVTMYNVIANGDIGNVTAGELKISEEGDRLVFTDHPVLILNQTKNINE